MTLSGNPWSRAQSPLALRLGRRAAATWAELAPGRAVPAAVRAELGLEPGERVLSAAGDRGGECALVATDRAVYYRVSAGGGAGGEPAGGGAGGEPAGGSAGGEPAGGGAGGEPAGGGAGGEPAGGSGWSRLGWEQVAQIGWDAAAGRLIVIGVCCAGIGWPTGDAPASTVGSGQDGPPVATVAPRVAVPLRQRGTVPELAAERVAHTRLGQWQLRVGGRRRAVIEARRRPVTGELLWSVTPDANGHGDLDIGVHAKRAIARLSAEFGALSQEGTGLTWPPQVGGRAAAAE